MQCSANDTNYQDDARYLEKEGALGEAVCQAQGLTKPKKSFSASGGGKLLVNVNDSTTIQVLVASVKVVHKRYQMRTHHNGTKNIFSGLFFCARPRATRTAMQSQNLKVTTYTSFFRQCKSKIKPWGGY